jgi:hypothetical protein
MKIKLNFLLRKKRIKLIEFCKINNLQTFKELLKYCELKNLICVDEKEYMSLFPKIEKDEKEVQLQPKTRRRGRKPKAKKSGNVNKKSSS